MAEPALRTPSEAVERATSEATEVAAAAAQIERDIQKLRPIRGRVLHAVVVMTPWVVLAAMVALVAAMAAGEVRPDPMFITGLLAAAVAAFLFQVLLHELPETMLELFRRGVFAVPQSPSGAEANPVEQTYCAYRAYIDRIYRELNSRLSWVCGLGIAGAMFMSFPARYSPYYPAGSAWWLHPFWWLNGHDLRDWDFFGGLALQLALAFILGLLLWRMAVIAVRVAGLGSTFDFDLKPKHPDHSAGLHPLGDLCLTNALIISVPAIYLAGWLIVIPTFSQYAAYVWYFYGLLVLVFVLAVITFALPLYAVHLGMLRQRAKLLEPLYELGARIDGLSQALREEARTGSADRLDQLREEQETLAGIYQATSDIPSWPFDRSLLHKFSISQLIPLLSLTGIAPGIVSALEKVFG